MLAGATIQNRAKELPPRRTARCHALASGGPRSVVRLFAHRSIASCDINVLPFTTHVNKAQTPLPTTNSALELEVIFCVQGVISPILANVYLHYAYDLWVQRWRRTKATGGVIVVRFADDRAPRRREEEVTM